MGAQLDGLSDSLSEFIARQHMFFVATAAPDGRVNVSPKGMDSLQVLGPNRLMWLNLTGSGNETAGHLIESNRMTLMWCAFQGDPMILRAYGTARTLHPADAGWGEAYGHFPKVTAARQIFDMEIDLVQTSCGMGVPVLAFEKDRVDDQLINYFDRLGPEKTRLFQTKKNMTTLDGRPTGLIVAD